MPSPDDPTPFALLDGDPSRAMLLIADHARNVLPPSYGTLGIAPQELRRHIAYDIGIEGVTRAVAARLGVPAVLCGFSRLLIDPNRGEDDPTLIRQLYDRTVITGNYPITRRERERRLQRWYRPYHAAIRTQLERVEAASGVPAFLVSLHSFTPSFHGGQLRPWHVSLLWDRDDRAKRPLAALLAANPNLVIGDNEPYDGALAGDTLMRHGTAAGRAHVLIEIRQDLIESAEGQQEWGERLAVALAAVNARPDMHERKFYGTRTSAHLPMRKDGQ